MEYTTTYYKKRHIQWYGFSYGQQNALSKQHWSQESYWAPLNNGDGGEGGRIIKGIRVRIISGSTPT